MDVPQRQRDRRRVKARVHLLQPIREEVDEAEEVAAADQSVFWTTGRTCWAMPMLELAALTAERLGDDDLAKFYAEEGKERYSIWPVVSGSCRGVLARVRKWGCPGRG